MKRGSKSEYERPSVTVLGTVESVTQGANPGTGDTQGGFS
jgi:hypothetical protein